MAPFPEEVDVFTAPHWRMKQLVGLYCDKLSKTNFSNNNDFRALLQSLYATFKEFKMHEQIENEYIIGLLQQRSQTVYNVHSDNKLSEMLSLFEKGLKNVKNEYEQLNYAKQLKERLEAFTRDFLPHMKEEEEVFQPMLMEYFTYEELKDIKKKVIAQHCSQKETAAEIRRGISLWNQAEELQKAFKYSVDEKADHETEEPEQATSIVHLPSEVMLTIFTYLSPQELCRCSQVSSKWSQLAKTGFLWKHLYPVHWARGNWSRGPPGDLDTEPDEEWVKNRKDESQAFQEWDEDADIDESEENGEESSAISIVQKEKDLLQGIIHNILPRVGSSVKTIVLAYSSALSNKMVRHILELCPNLEYLDLTQTDISDSAFESWSWIGCCQSLRHLDLSGCERITDMAVRKISKALGILSSHEIQSQKSFQNRRGKTVWKNEEIALEFSKKDCGLHYITNENVIKEEGSHWNVPVRSEGFNSAYIWMLDAKYLADIEDAAEWKHRKFEGDRVIEPASPFPCSASCCNKGIFGLRTSFCWQEQQPCASVALTYCGHSFCCAGSALKTFQALPPSPELLNHTPRTNRQREGKDLTHLMSAKSDQKAARVLQFLSLSGCYQITDNGLRMLALRGGLPYLEHLNLSGCLTVTSAGLQDLVSVCPSLNHEHFYYCDNINGPHAGTASGCQNLQCGFRACCRSGE
ncbi:F-box/LRR-repeat protein 5 [Notechis scutatus]|uniref:F-box/LRR-repeat protein 5 n=1 Tax=Notechis scutatus TaxID=8663 RepID=A0A6J1UVJ2_9SAUR|nr:F-box/LRR-repeat protein 5 [Notechis scutatus]